LEANLTPPQESTTITEHMLLLSTIHHRFAKSIIETFQTTQKQYICTLYRSQWCIM